MRRHLERVFEVRPGGRRVTPSTVGGRTSPGAVDVDGRPLIDARSDDALGLATDPRVRDAAIAASRRFGLRGGDVTSATLDFEARFAHVHRREAAVFFASSAAMHDSLRQVGLVTSSHPTSGVDLVMTEGLRRADGAIEALAELDPACASVSAGLWIDDSLAFGVLGATGAGTSEHLNVDLADSLLSVDLAASLAGAGVVVAGPRAFVDVLRALRFPEAVPPASTAAASTRALELIAAEPQRRERLFDIAELVHREFAKEHLDTGPSVTHRIPVWVGEWRLAEDAVAACAADGVLVDALEPFPDGARLLISCQATHSDAQVAQLVETVTKVARRASFPRTAPRESSGLGLARPGSFSRQRPAGPHWQPRQPTQVAEPSPARSSARSQSSIFEALETITWRTTQKRAGDIARLLERTEALRRLVRRGPTSR